MLLITTHRYITICKDGSVIERTGPVLIMRDLFPLASCFLSYVNPWTMILTTDSLRRKLQDMYQWRKHKITLSSETIVSARLKPLNGYPRVVVDKQLVTKL
ncbi:hypothetical protein Y032_0038g3553 [Ancylostoma ceylanicum]|uniref:Uncharacterized protein n=1 Tax=Ancylostoma ceylanicum TaxID=53326 RepID=A0A016UJA1_9BILA|nr:hypothetical protein Y032_0038g3553 [Ancylostoma ceylanicum]